MVYSGMDPFEGEPSTSAVRYKPISVKDLLVEMKDTAELLINLSYSAVLTNDNELAGEVIRLEERMDILELRAGMSLLMAARNPTDAEQLAPVISIVAATDAISDAAADIAKVIREDIKLPEAIRTALPEAGEIPVRGVVATDSPYVDRTLMEIDLESRTGVRIIALRRGEEWLFSPGPDTTIRVDDVAIMRGPGDGIATVKERLTGEPYRPPTDGEPAIDDLERAVDTIVHMKDLSELSVDLAYSSVLFGSTELAEEVRNIEVEVDALLSRFEAWVLEAASDAEDPVALRGLIHIGTSAESISDAAVDISEGVFRDIDVHSVVRLAVQESDEILTRIEVQRGSQLEATPIDADLSAVDPTMRVIGVRRPGEGWIVGGDLKVTAQAGDVLITKGTRAAAERIEALAGA